MNNLMNKVQYVEVEMDLFLEMLENRKNKVDRNFGWTIPDGLWEMFTERLECGAVVPKNYDPMYIVDNLAVNGDYGIIEESGAFEDPKVRQYLETTDDFDEDELL